MHVKIRLKYIFLINKHIIIRKIKNIKPLKNRKRKYFLFLFFLAYPCEYVDMELSQYLGSDGKNCKGTNVGECGHIQVHI